MSFSQLGWIIANIIMPSLPEQICYIYLTMLFLGKSEFIKINWFNIRKIMYPSLILAVTSVILRLAYPKLSQSGVFIILGVLLTWALSTTFYRISIKESHRVLIATIFSFLCVSIIQLSYAPFFLYATNVEIDSITKPGIMAIIWSMPEITILICAIVLINARRKIGEKVSIINILSRNKYVLAISLAVLVFNVAFIGAMVKILCFDKILLGLEAIYQIVIIVIVMMFPILNISMLVSIVYSNYYRETIRIMLSKERINILLSILRIYTEEKNYSKVDTIINDLGKQLTYL